MSKSLQQELRELANLMEQSANRLKRESKPGWRVFARGGELAGAADIVREWCASLDEGETDAPIEKKGGRK